MATFDPKYIKLAMYRPFTKKWLFYDKEVIERPRLYYKKMGQNNKVIITSGRSSNKDFSTLITNCYPDVQLLMNAQGFMKFDNSNESTLLSDGKENITSTFTNKIGLTQNDVFAYVYGLLNSKEYQEKYQNDLKKELARIPICKNKEKYIEIGKKLIELHLNYEKVVPYDDVNIAVKGEPNYQVTKMKFARKRNPETGKLENDRSTILFNSSITISNIPLRAYDYIVNGKSAIEWIIDQYQIKTDKKSEITDDPNDFSDDPKYIFNLLLRIINVSLKTIDLINQLPKFEVKNDQN